GGAPAGGRRAAACHSHRARGRPGGERRARGGRGAGGRVGRGVGGRGGGGGRGPVEAMPPRGAANAPSRVSGRSAAVVVAGVAGDGVVGVGEREGARRTAASGDCPATSSSRGRRCPSLRRRRFPHRRPKAQRPSRTTRGAGTGASHSGPR